MDKPSTPVTSMPRHTILALLLLGITMTAVALVVIQPQFSSIDEPTTQETMSSQGVQSFQAIGVDYSRCADRRNWLALTDDAPYRPFNLQVIMQDGSPVQGLCIVFLRDLLPSRPIQYIGACRTGQNGRCTLSVPVGLIRLYFADSSILGRNLDLSVNEIRPAGMGRTDNLAYIIDEDSITAEAVLVVTLRGEEYITIKSATRSGDGTLTILNPDVPDWTQQSIE